MTDITDIYAASPRASIYTGMRPPPQGYHESLYNLTPRLPPRTYDPTPYDPTPPTESTQLDSTPRGVPAPEPPSTVSSSLR